MKIEQNQSHIDVAILEYGNQAAFYKIGADNSFFTPTVSVPYDTQEFPVQFIEGTEVESDSNDELFTTEQIKELKRSKFKLASKP